MREGKNKSRYIVLLIISFFVLQKISDSNYIPSSKNSLLNLAKFDFSNPPGNFLLTNKEQKLFINNNYSNKNIKKQNIQNTSLVTIYFDGIPSNINISKAALKYNKTYAYSLTLDDGKEDAYTNVFPLLSGGYSSGTSQTYPGLHFTDGCGNNIPFEAGLALNSVGSNGLDNHVNTMGSITWEQVKELYNNNWDVFNHSYDHKYGPGTDYNAEINNNTSYIKSKTGIDLTHFVIPSGDSEYATYAFNNGMKAVYNQKDFPGGSGLKIDGPIELKNFKLYRQYLNDDNYSIQIGKADYVASLCSSTNHYWYNEFTHHVSTTQETGGLMFSTFKTHIENLENSYGANGSDILWMAPLQEVYEYLSVRENTVIENSVEGDKANITLDFSQVPKDLRRYAMTLVVVSDQNITSVESSTAAKISFNGTDENKIINLEWTTSPNGTTGIFNNKNRNMELVNAYPNPVENELTIYLPRIINKKVNIDIYDEKGIEYTLGEIEVLNEIAQLDLRRLNLKKGLYIIKINTKDGSLQSSKTIVKY